MIIYQEYSGLFTMSWLFVKCLVGVVLLAFAQYFFNQAIMTGNTGVVVTLGKANVFIFLMSDYIIFNKEPEILDILACFIFLIGTGILVLGDSIKFAIGVRQ